MEQLAKQVPVEYGSDRNGLIWGYAFRAGALATPIHAEDVPSEPGAARSDGSFFWLHFAAANSNTERWLRQYVDLPAGFYNGLRASSSATRVEQDGDALVAVINDMLFAFESDHPDVSTMTLGVLPGAMIIARLKPLRSIERLRESVKAGAICRSPVDLLAHLLKNQADVLAELVRKSGPQIDEIEDGLLTSRLRANRAQLSTMRRMLVRLQRLMAPEPAALFRLLNRPPVWIAAEDLQELRQTAEEFALVVGDCAALVERLKLVQEELVAMVNEQTNRSVLLLTFATVMLLPFNVVGGLFGMNVGGIPFAESTAGFWTVVVLITAPTVLLGSLLLTRFRR